MLLRLGDQGVERRRRVVPTEVLARGLVGLAGREEAVECVLEGRGLFRNVRDRVVDVLLGVDRTVEHQGPVVAGEQRGVRGAEEGAVGEAQVGELAVADSGAEGVHVPCDVRGRDVPEDLSVPLHARVDVRLHLGDVGGAVERLGCGHRLRVDAQLLLVHPAVDRRGALPDAAGVEGDDVEALVEVGEEAGTVALQIVDSGAAWATEVEEERSDAVGLVRRGHPRHGDLHLARRAAGRSPSAGRRSSTRPLPRCRPRRSGTASRSA